MVFKTFSNRALMRETQENAGGNAENAEATETKNYKCPRLQSI
jgi:hypothetical protein